MVQERVHHWTHHVGEDVLANEVNTVLDDDDAEVDELVHHKAKDWVLVIEGRVAEADVAVVHHWIQIAVLVKFQVRLEVELKVLEDELDLGEVGQEPVVDLLLSIDLPVLDGWELDSNEVLVGSLDEVNFSVGHIQIDTRVGDVGPVELPLQQVKEEAELVGVLLWQVHIKVDVVRQEVLHGLLELVDGSLLEPQLHTWVHSRGVGLDCIDPLSVEHVVLEEC